MGKTDLHRYALVHFQIDISYKYTATPHENCKKFRKPYLKMMSSTTESLKTSVSGKKPKSVYIDIMGKVGKSGEKYGKPPSLVNYANTIIKQIMQGI